MFLLLTDKHYFVFIFRSWFVFIFLHITYSIPTDTSLFIFLCFSFNTFTDIFSFNCFRTIHNWKNSVWFAVSLFNLKLLESSGLLDVKSAPGPSTSGAAPSTAATSPSLPSADGEGHHFLRNGNKGFYHCLHCEYKTLCRYTTDYASYHSLT